MQGDIKSFRQLRSQLAPVLNIDANQLLERVEAVLGASTLEAPQIPQKKKGKRLTHADRVAQFLIPKKPFNLV